MNCHPDTPPFPFSFSCRGWLLRLLLLLVEADLSLGAVKDYSSTHHVTLIPPCLFLLRSANQDEGCAVHVCVLACAYLSVAFCVSPCWLPCLSGVFVSSVCAPKVYLIRKSLRLRPEYREENRIQSWYIDENGMTQKYFNKITNIKIGSHMDNIITNNAF